MFQWIWQHDQWPDFRWDNSKLEPELKRVRLLQGKLAGLCSGLTSEPLLEYRSLVLSEEIIETSAIEGEILDRASVRSSVARRLGLLHGGHPQKKRGNDHYVEGLVTVLLEAMNTISQPLLLEQILTWHHILFSEKSNPLHKVTPGQLRTGPVFVVSGYVGREQVHFEAPPAESLIAGLNVFLKWFNQDSHSIDGIVRAGLAHFWFVVLHPFDDGNGRMTRVISEMALAQDEYESTRLYSVSAQIMRERKSYYKALESSSELNLDLTEWLVWFIGCLGRAIEHSLAAINLIIMKSQFWQRHAKTELNERQRKVISKLLDADVEGFEGGLTTRKYVSMTKVSRATAYRELTDLVNKKCIYPLETQGRNTAYAILWE